MMKRLGLSAKNILPSIDTATATTNEHEQVFDRWLLQGLSENTKSCLFSMNPSGQNRRKAVCRSVFFTTWHYILSAELTNTHSFRLFFGDFAHWEGMQWVRVVFIQPVYYSNQVHLYLCLRKSQIKNTSST